MIRKNQGIYAVYKGDKFIDLGTKRELAERMHVRPDFIAYLATPSNKKRIRKDNALIVIKIGKVGDLLWHTK